MIVFQSVTPQKLDLIRMQLSEELERTYRDRSQQQDAEVEELRTTCNKLKHELFFLKSSFEHEQNESRQVLGELKLVHDAEVYQQTSFTLAYYSVCFLYEFCYQLNI